MNLSLDYETRSLINLPATGAYVYAQHPSTDIILGAWMFDDMDEPEIWMAGRQCPQRIVDHVEAGGEIRAHNAAFERLMWQYVAAPKYGWPVALMEQFVCSAAEAAAMSLPRSLGQLASVLGIEQQKDDSGHRLMMRMCKPRSIRDDGTPVWWEDAERMEKLAAYCKQDVRTERAASKVLRRLTPREREVYLLTERMNDRGVQTDTALIAAAIGVSERGIDEANVLLRELTGGSVAEVTKVAQIKAWLMTQDVNTTSLDKAAVRELLDSDLPETARAVLELRAGAGRSSVSKLVTMQTAACTDGRCRGMSLYHGAGTGRWTGRLVQPHNFPRGEIDKIESYIPFVLEEDYEKIALMQPPIIVVMSMLRSMLTAAPGHELIVGDFSAIEARVLNWLAGQNDMVELFRKYDAAAPGEKDQFDPYRVNASRLYNIPLSKVEKFPHRHTGKFQELGCGFGMGAKKAVTAGKDVYQLTMTDEFAAEVVNSYRRTHPKVVALWFEAERALLHAVQLPGSLINFGGGTPHALREELRWTGTHFAYFEKRGDEWAERGDVKYTGNDGPLRAFVSGAYLHIMLPSRRTLVYPAPRQVMRPTPWGDSKLGIEFSGVHPKTNQWTRMGLYGGLIVENIVQAVARDLLAEAKLRLEAAGYTPILSVHDEAVCEVPVGFGSVEEFERLLSATPEWAAGCPVAAEGWRGFRYRK